MSNYGEFSEQISQLIGSGSPFESSEIASALSQHSNYQYNPQQVGALTPGMLRAANLQTYQPIAELKQQSMLSDLAKGMEGSQMRGAMGNFASSGSTYTQKKAARDVYGQSAADVIKEISSLQQQGRRGVLDVINSWRNLIASTKG